MCIRDSISGEVKATTTDAETMVKEGEAIYALDPKHMVCLLYTSKVYRTSAPILSRSVSGNARTERLFAFPPLHTSPPK